MTPDVQLCLDCAILQKVVIICAVVLIAVILFAVMIVLSVAERRAGPRGGS